jgi:fumarate hydratase class II
MADVRIERDSMGEMEVPATARYGASTHRALLNFPISGYRFGRRFIRALGLIKYAAAMANELLGRLDPVRARVIKDAAREVMDGKHDDQFVLDIFQTGSGTSTNTNANEVIAHRSNELLTHGEAAGPQSELRVHPNAHVNMGQSSNDVIPSAIHIAAVEALKADLMPALHRLHNALKAKAEEFDSIVKIGRTHLMDATPIRLGQEFSGYASQIEHADRRLMQKIVTLRELPIGGTAVGTGLNTHPDFARRVCEIINHETRESFQEAANHFEAQHAKDAVVAASGALKVLAISLTKIANDIRLLGSGPRCGIGELLLPTIQPGSSIMPGKVNPVIPEPCFSLRQVLVRTAITYAPAGGNLDLHVGMPVMAHNLLESSACWRTRATCLWTSASAASSEQATLRELIERSLAMCTSLAPVIGTTPRRRLRRKPTQPARPCDRSRPKRAFLSPPAGGAAGSALDDSSG